MAEPLDLRPGGSTDRGRVREMLYARTNDAALLAVVDAWFFSGISEETVASAERLLSDLLAVNEPVEEDGVHGS